MEIFAFPWTNKPWFVTQKFCFAPSQICLSARYSQWKIPTWECSTFKHKFISLPFSCLFPFLFSLVFSPFSFLSFLFPILSYSFFLPFTFYVLSLVLSCLFPHLTCLCVLSFPFSLVSLVFSLFFSLVLSFLSFHFLVSFFISFFFLVPSVVCVLSFPLRFAVKPNFYFNLKMKLWR